MLWVGAVAVQHGRHLAGAARAPRCTLAGLLAYRCRQLVLAASRSLGHSCCSSCAVAMLVRGRVATTYCGFPSITVARTTLAVTPAQANRSGPQSANSVPVSCSESSQSAPALLASRARG